MKIFNLIYFILCFGACAAPLYAYVDPMTGSSIIYLCFGILTAIYFFFRTNLYRIFNVIKGIGLKQKNKYRKDCIVFYSEGGQYWQVFEPVICELEKFNIVSYYLTSDKNDPGLLHASKYTIPKYLGYPTLAYVFLNNLQATLVVMTTPQIDIMTLRRSKFVKHYSHIIHAPTDIHTYRKFAFDYFDSIFCSGEHQIKSIRKLEKKRNLSKKKLYKTGLTYLDYMEKKISNNYKPISRKKLTILVAPTWQEFSLLNRIGFFLLDEIVCSQNIVILRPHSQSFISFPEIIKNIEKKYAGSIGFSIDKRPSAIESLMAADIMISDISGIIFDFAFLFQKPVIMIDVPSNFLGTESTDINHLAWEFNARLKIGKIIKEEQIPSINSIIKTILSEFTNRSGTELRKRSLYNFKQAGKFTAAELKKLVEELNQNNI